MLCPGRLVAPGGELRAAAEVDRLVQLRRAESGDVQPGRALRGIRDLARVPDAVWVWLGALRPRDEPAVTLGGAGAETLGQDLELLEARLGLDPETPQLFDGHLQEGLARLVPRVRREDQRQRLAVPGEDPVGAAHEAGLRE